MFPLFLKEQALKPCPEPRSRDLQKLAPIESSPNLNLTDLVKNQGPDFHQNPQPAVYLQKTRFDFWESSTGKRKVKLSMFLSFPFHVPLKI